LIPVAWLRASKARNRSFHHACHQSTKQAARPAFTIRLRILRHCSQSLECLVWRVIWCSRHRSRSSGWDWCACHGFRYGNLPLWDGV
jgi:hypothetical protein